MEPQLYASLSNDMLTPAPCRTIVFGLGNGGTAGLIYLYIIVVVFFTFVNISMAEMASMAPTAGEFAADCSTGLQERY
jgi:amino acid transporter